MNNQELANYLNENFVCAFKQVSYFSVSSQKNSKKDKVRKSSLARIGGNVASYFCDPNGRVLEIVIGPVEENRLKLSAKQSHDLYTQIKNVPTQEGFELARKHATDLIASETLQSFEGLLKRTRWNGRSILKEYSGRNYSDAAILDASRAALAAVEAPNSMLHRKNLTDEYTKSLSRHAKYGGRSSFGIQAGFLKSQTDKQLFGENLLLAELPLVRIDRVEKPVFEIMMGQPYMEIDREDLSKKVADCRSAFTSGKGVLVVISESVKQQNDFGFENESEPSILSHLLKSKAIRSQQEHFEFIELDKNELMLVMSELKLRPLDNTLMRRSPIRRSGIGFILFGSDGNLKKIIRAGSTSNVVNLALKRFAVIEQDGKETEKAGGVKLGVVASSATNGRAVGPNDRFAIPALPVIAAVE